ncbi:unnamed protein product [Ectocarpus sp. 6 AP-2014]
MSEEIAARIEENEAIKSFIAHRDADMVQEACAGLGTDDEQLMIILCCRTKAQLERIDQAYRAKYKKTLWEKVKGDVGGNYKKMMRYALMERDEFVSHVIDEACSGLGTNESLLIDVLAPLSNDEIAAAKAHWEAKNDESLVDKLNSEIRGGLRELVVGLLTGKRGESEEADEALAEEQATKLYDAGVGKFVGTDDEVFIDIIGTSPSVQIQAIKTKYEEAQGMSLHKAISKEFRGDLKAVLQCMLEPPVDYYCATIRRATKRMGTNEAAICRVLGGNDKGRLSIISERFTEKYDTTLHDMASSELRGHFQIAVSLWVDATADPTFGAEQQLVDLPAGEDQDEKRLKLLEEENDGMKTYIAKVDAEQIWRACKGMGTNEGRVIGIICTRTKSQVERIDEASSTFS